MKDIIEIVKSLEDSSLLPEEVSETIHSEAISMLLGTPGAILFGNPLTGKGINRAGVRILRTGYGNKKQDYENKMV